MMNDKIPHIGKGIAIEAMEGLLEESLKRRWQRLQILLLNFNRPYAR